MIAITTSSSMRVKGLDARGKDNLFSREKAERRHRKTSFPLTLPFSFKKSGKVFADAKTVLSLRQY